MNSQPIIFTMVSDAENLTDAQKIDNLYEVIYSLKNDLTKILSELENRVTALEG